MQIPNLHDGCTPLCFFSQQLQQLFGVHRQNRAVCPTGNGVGQRLLGLLQFHDLFLNGVLRDQPVHLYRVALTDAVGAVGGLILRGKVPPRVVVDDDIGGGQVETCAARPQRDQKDVCLATLSGLLFCPLFKQ